MACNIALDAVNIVALEENNRKEIDIKRYARIEKVTEFNKSVMYIVFLGKFLFIEFLLYRFLVAALKIRLY